jgi:hypothetical protein
MAEDPKADPTKDATFQKVVGYFLRTPHKPHSPDKPKPSGKQVTARPEAKPRKAKKPAK